MGINQYERDERVGKLPGDLDTPYLRLDAIVKGYAQSFEIDDGAGCQHTPSDYERFLVEQSVHELICREDFMETIVEARAMTHEARKAEGQHPCCGAGLGHPHYPICVNSPRSQGTKP